MIKVKLNNLLCFLLLGLIFFLLSITRPASFYLSPLITTTTFVDDCQEISANNYTSTWNVGIHSTVADSSTTYQRNSELTQIHTRQISCDGTIISVGDDVIDDRHHIGSIALQTYFFAIKSAEICTNLASTQIGGTVFEDWNFDGIMNQSDTVGVQGIEVIAYDCNNNAISTTYTDANGNYRFDGLIANQDYRIEFSLPASIDNWANPTPAGTDNGTTVQFLLACQQKGKHWDI